jgi:oligopeptide/dipeptide ABC transporter ATP-binding protein
VNETLIRIEDACIHFPVRSGLMRRAHAYVRAVDGVTLHIEKGDALGLVGESGSGKTTLVNGITMLEPLTSGEIWYRDLNVANASSREQKGLRKTMQIVFQDPFWSLDPRWLVLDIVGEPLRAHTKLRGDAYRSAVVDALEMVGLTSSELYRYPHEYAGGIRQRIAIARALSIQPEMVILDEPTSAIDVVSQHRILALLESLKERLDLTYILVSHDLSVVGYLANKVAVMYGGKLLEVGFVEDVFGQPLHPYTQALLKSVPKPTAFGIESLVSLEGEVSSALAPPSGCRFHPRCQDVMDVCSRESPPSCVVGDRHYVSCWLYAEEGAQG